MHKLFGCLLILVSRCCFVFSKAEQQQKFISTNVGDGAIIECFDTSWGSGDDVFFVQIEFQLIGESDSKVFAKYLPSNSEKIIREEFASFEDAVTFYTRGNVGYMKIEPVSLLNEGTYNCKGTSFYAQANLVWITHLTVFVPPTLLVVKITDPIPASIDSLTDVARCDATGGKPAAEVKWEAPRHHQIDQEPRTTNDSNGLSTVASVLQFVPTRFYDKEVFVCKITHPGFNKTYSEFFTANVTYAPASLQIKADSDNKFLTCLAQGNPPVKYSWVLPGNIQATGPTVELMNSDDPARGNDTYTCIVQNSLGQTSVNITTWDAVHSVSIPQEASVGMIVGLVIGVLAFIGIVIFLLYYFYFRKFRQSDKGPYHQRATLVRQTTDKPTIQHANDTLNKNRPPSPSQPPPYHDQEDDHSSSSDTDDEGNHDVDLETKVPQYNPPEEENEIKSRSSVNFRARRHRPTSTHSSRRSRAESQMQKQADDSPPPHQNSRYDYPPEDEENVRYYDKGDYVPQGQQFSNDTYPMHHPRYGGYPTEQQANTRKKETRSQLIEGQDEEEAGFGHPSRYEAKYSEIDHSDYRQGSGSRRPPHEEPVEYAQIMKHRTDIV